MVAKKLQGKCALVTGANGGIGRAVVRALRQAGARVAAADRDCEGLSADALLAGDLADGAYADGLPSAAAEALGGLDIVVNNAGVMRRGAVTSSSDADFDALFDINVKAPFRVCRAALPLLVAEGGGAIVNTASCWGLYPGPDHALYCASKAAIASLTRCMGRDHAPQGVRVNAVCPNEVDTPMLRSGFELRGFEAASAISELGQSVPLGRVAQPEDIADVVVFLASEESRYMCGALLEVNGAKAVS